MKTCTKCGEEKPLEDFHQSGRQGKQRRPDCKECVNRRNREGEYALKKVARKYGLTTEQYTEMINRGCDVCGSKEDMVIDHDHNCCPGTRTCGNCVTGPLCRKHNTAEAFLGSEESAFAMYQYMVLKRLMSGWKVVW